MSPRSASAEKDMNAFLQTLAACRDVKCPVPACHPFYWSAEPVAPIAPTYLATGDIMMIASFPTAAFANFDEQNVRDVPSYDVFEILADTRYFDGEKVRDARAGTLLRLGYLDALGIDRSRLWLTNTVKCFLFDKSQAGLQKQLPLLKPIRILPTRERFFECADVCVRNWLSKELKLADPKIIFTLGEEAARVVHGRKADAPAGFFESVVGVPLTAGVNAGAFDHRTPDFAGKNVFHFVHPADLVADPAHPLAKAHWEKHLPAAFAFMKALSIPADRTEVAALTDDTKSALAAAQPFAADIDHG